MSWLDNLEDIRKRDWSEASMEERAAKAHDVVNVCSYAAGLTSLMPIPLADLALLLPVHSAMVMTIGHVYGRPVSQTEAKRIVLELGAVAGVAFAGTAAISALRRLVLPGLGGLLSVSATFALTWGLGRVSMSYFENPDLSRDDLKKVFDEAMKEGKKSFSKEAFDRFRKKNEGVKPSGSPSEPPPEVRASEPPPEVRASEPPPPSASRPPPAEPKTPPKRPSEEPSVRPPKKRTL